MAITAGMVKELRERTSAGMMECKKALVATDGDLDAAADHLRKSGLAKADKKASRIASEGRIQLLENDTQAVLLEVNSETDFAAKDDNFVGFSKDVAETILESNVETVDALQVLTDNSGKQTVEEKRQALVAKIGENVQIRRFSRFSSQEHVIGAYLHGSKIGVLVEMQGGDKDLAKDIAMHVAAMRPAFVSADEVPQDIIAKEKSILVDQAAQSGKPPEIIEKMVEGRLRKYLAEITLLGQAFVKDGDITVDKLVNKAGAKIIRFLRLEVGEGIEKKEDNFVEEVMAQVQR